MVKMNLEEFLLFLHEGAYEVSKHLFMNDLTIHDRISLRFVSRTFNDIILDYPIRETLHISTHEEDLRCLKTISQNDKILKHIKSLMWYHDTHDFLALHRGMNMLPGSMQGPQFSFGNLMDGPYLDEEEIEISEEDYDTKKFLTWAKLANQQYINIMQNQDYKVMQKMLPKLKRVSDIVFIWNQYSLGFSPMLDQWRKLYHELRTIHREAVHLLFGPWQYINGLWIPGSTCTEPGALQILCPPSESENDMWANLGVRGIRFFENLWRQNTQLPEDVRLRWELPALKRICLYNPPTPGPSGNGSPPEKALLRESTQGIEKVQLSLLTRAPPSSTLAIRSSILAGASSLKSLHLGFVGSIWLLQGILAELPELKKVSLQGRDVSYDSLVALGQRIRSHPQLRKLELVSISHIDRGEAGSNKHWDGLMRHWRETQDLARLESLFIPWARDDRPESRNGYYKTHSGTLDWLKGGPGNALIFKSF